MTKTMPRMPDVLRLIELKRKVRELVLGEETASSVAAFIAWKALLLASNVERGSEHERLQAATANCLRNYPNELRSSLTAFVLALRHLSGPDITPAIRADWIGDPRGVGQEVERVLRDIKQLVIVLPKTADKDLPKLARSIAAHLARIRNVVIGHAQVTTGTPLFPIIVRPFEDLVTKVAELTHHTLNS
jgi:hypothetical protein